MIEYSGKVTVFDRFAVGFLCALITFLTLNLAWLAIHRLFLHGDETGFSYLFQPIIIISIIAGFIGFFNKEGMVIKIVTPLWQLIVNIFRAL